MKKRFKLIVFFVIVIILGIIMLIRQYNSEHSIELTPVLKNGEFLTNQVDIESDYTFTKEFVQKYQGKEFSIVEIEEIMPNTMKFSIVKSERAKTDANVIFYPSEKNKRKFLIKLGLVYSEILEREESIIKNEKLYKESVNENIILFDHDYAFRYKDNMYRVIKSYESSISYLKYDILKNKN